MTTCILLAWPYPARMTLSPKMTDRAVKAAKALKAASAEVKMLRSVAWPDDASERFLSGGASALPEIDYAPVDTRDARGYIEDAVKLCEGDHPVTEWLSRSAHDLRVSADMIDARGSKDFYAHSKTLFGTPQNVLLDGKTKVIDLAHHVDSILSDLDADHLVLDGADERLTDTEFAQRLEPKLADHFGEDAPRIDLTPNLSARVTAGSRRIRVRAGASFTQMDVSQLLQHEALVHTATALNGRAQDNFPILGVPHAGTTQIQEGLAVFAEMIAGTMDPVRFRRLADRVIAIEMAVQGADFIDVFKFYQERIHDDAQAFENTRRVFRGGVLSGGAPFTKDMVYLNGLLRVHNFLRTVVAMNRADLIRLLFVGKLDLEDIPALAELAEHGLIKPAKYMPNWASDLRFVVSYLSYSSFLNRIKMPGFRGYYEDMLSAVPDMWSFHKG